MKKGPISVIASRVSKRAKIIAVGAWFFSVPLIGCAAGLELSGWGFGSATPTQVEQHMRSTFPGSHVAGQGDVVKVKKAKIGGGTFNVTASFSDESGTAILKSVVIDGVEGKNIELPGLEGFTQQSGKPDLYKKNSLDARVSRTGNHVSIAFEADTAAPSDEPNAETRAQNVAVLRGRAVTVLEWGGGIVALLLAFASLRYIWWWIAGGALGYIFGSWELGLFLGGCVAVVHLLISTSRSGGRKVIFSEALDATQTEQFSCNSANGMLDHMAINPANGSPMVGGMAGLDAHGNSYGTKVNDSNH
jgi:hypothetical protein